MYHMVTGAVGVVPRTHSNSLFAWNPFMEVLDEIFRFSETINDNRTLQRKMKIISIQIVSYLILKWKP